MLALSRKTDYAIIALSHLARSPGKVSNAREIAERFHVPAALLMNLLKSLAHKELVRSIRGSKGGYTLALPSDRITLSAIIDAIDGPVRLVQCASRETESACGLQHHCPVSHPVQKIHARLMAFLNNVTLADIANDETYGEEVTTVDVGVVRGDGERRQITVGRRM